MKMSADSLLKGLKQMAHWRFSLNGVRQDGEGGHPLATVTSMGCGVLKDTAWAEYEWRYGQNELHTLRFEHPLRGKPRLTMDGIAYENPVLNVRATIYKFQPVLIVQFHGELNGTNTEFRFDGSLN